MNINEVRSIIRQTIAEAIEEKKQGVKVEKSGNTLMDLKKELKSLKRMEEALGQFNLSEGGDGEFIAEYAHMQKYVNEFNKLKEAHARLSEMLGNQSSLVEQKIDEETQKIKQMMGLVKKESTPAKKAAPKKAEGKKPAPKKAEPKKDEKKPAAKPAAKKDK
jgi:hypothetical protein